MEPNFATHASPLGDSVLVHIQGDVDLTNSVQLRDDMAHLVDGGPDLILDLADVLFMDSEGLSVLLATRSALMERGGSLAVRNPSSPVRRVLDITGLAAMLIESTPRD